MVISVVEVGFSWKNNFWESAKFLLIAHEGIVLKHENNDDCMLEITTEGKQEVWNTTVDNVFLIPFSFIPSYILKNSLFIMWQ